MGLCGKRFGRRRPFIADSTRYRWKGSRPRSVAGTWLPPGSVEAQDRHRRRSYSVGRYHDTGLPDDSARIGRRPPPCTGDDAIGRQRAD